MTLLSLPQTPPPPPPPPAQTNTGNLLRVLEERDTVTPTAVCPYCGVGCVLRVKLDGDEVTQIQADRDARPNHGMMCPKGALVGRTLDGHQRLLQPLIRRRRGLPLENATWEEAIDLVATRLTAIREEHGPGALAWYGSGQLDTEASYVFTKFFKGFLGTNHTDTNSRLCMSSAVAGYKRAFGSDGPPTCYDDINHADVFFILGANMTANHPVLFNMIRKRRVTANHVRVIVVDPRRTRTAEHADWHLPVQPGGDVALVQLIIQRLRRRDALDAAFLDEHTRGALEFLAALDRLDEDELLSHAGVDPGVLDEVADLLAKGGPLLSFYCMGANQSKHGTDKNAALINLHLLTGQVGKPGTGPFSLTGQPNAMGGREVGYLSNQLPGYRFVDNAEHREAIENAWGLPTGSIHPEPGHTAIPMFEAANAGDLKAMWIACTNPVVTMPNASVAKAGLHRVELVVAQDVYADSETVAYADVVFPATQWGEKVGTMTNSERLVIRNHRFLDPPGGVRPDWWMPAAVARAMGAEGFDYVSADEVWEEFRLLTSGRPCDVSGMTNDRLRHGPLQWPCPDQNHQGSSRRYTDHRFDTADGKAVIQPVSIAGVAEPSNNTFPFVLTTGRVASQWHTRTKTGRISELLRQEPEPFIEIHPTDAGNVSVADGQWMRIRSRRGEAVGKARVTDATQPGVLFMPFHWGDAYHALTAVNAVTLDQTDAISWQPELKACAVRIEGVVPPPKGDSA